MQGDRYPPCRLGAAVLYISVTAHAPFAGLVVAGLGRFYHMALFAAPGTVEYGTYALGPSIPKARNHAMIAIALILGLFFALNR